jgi:hypothetical protein
VLSISGLLHLFSGKWLRRVSVTIIILVLLITPIITGAAYIISPWFGDSTYTFSGRHIIFNQDKGRNEAYVWIRENTPTDALVLLPYVDTSNQDMVAQNSTYEAAALTERNLFVVRDWYTSSNPEYVRRVTIREKILLNEKDPDVRNFLKSLNRPVYLLVEDKLPSMYLTDKIFNNFPDDQEGFLLVFRNELQRVFLKQK